MFTMTTCTLQPGCAVFNLTQAGSRGSARLFSPVPTVHAVPGILGFKNLQDATALFQDDNETSAENKDLDEEGWA